MNFTPESLTERTPGLRCEIRAGRRLIPILAGIVQTCARDLGQAVAIEPVPVGGAALPSVTLVLGVELALQQHHAWRLACRVACFCPEARVSVLITGIEEAVESDASARADAA